VTQYTVASPKLPASFNGYKIVQITDLHSKSFGPGNAELIKRINAIDPDLIVVTGDMMNSKNDDGHVFEELAAKLVKRYPVYCVSGNHEEKVQSDEKDHYFAAFKTKLIGMGVKYIDNASAKITRGGRSIGIYGVSVPLSYYTAAAVKGTSGKNVFGVAQLKQRMGTPDRAQFNILLAHPPYYFSSYAGWGADLTFSGHLHGGIVRLPFVGGLFSPELALFPKYDAGEFKSGDARMIVGRGLGNSVVNIRVFDRPELVEATLKTAK
jgi:predicted MPP superfamily phosphohydrolase